MAPKPPIGSYIISGVGIFSKPFAVIMEQAFSTTEFWKGMPWWYLSIGFALFLGGQLWADFRNGNSWISWWLRNKYRLFDVEKVFAEHNVENGETWFTVKAKIRFARRVKRATILLDIAGNTGRHSIVAAQNQDYAINSQEKLRLARIPIENHKTGTWGDHCIPVNTLPIVNGSKSVITIDVQSHNLFFKRQKHRVFLELMANNAGTCGRFYLTDDNETPLP